MNFKQLSFFNDTSIMETAPEGLSYFPEYITSEEEANLLKLVDSNEWDNSMKRRVQHYGYLYNYKTTQITDDDFLGNIPDWLNELLRKLVLDGIFKDLPHQIIVNEYMPGQGISKHIDSISAFTDTICSLSLNSKCVMDFVKDDKKFSLMLEPRSMLVLNGSARYEWQHGIAARKFDKDLLSTPRQRRTSITFRELNFRCK